MTVIIDNPADNDNRCYNYSKLDFYERAEFPIIINWLKAGSKVIDLGCGNGSLMKYILDKKSVDITGIELTESGVEYCQSHDLRAKTGAIDKTETYQEYADNQFDYAICNVTLQMLTYPEVLLREMKRIARFQIISFPNFAYFGNRFDLLFHGRMPRPMIHGYKWYNTGHIHQLSLRDFKNYCQKNGLNIVKMEQLGCFKAIANVLLPNWFSKESVCLLSKN